MCEEYRRVGNAGEVSVPRGARQPGGRRQLTQGAVTPVIGRSAEPARIPAHTTRTETLQSGGAETRAARVLQVVSSPSQQSGSSTTEKKKKGAEKLPPPVVVPEVVTSGGEEIEETTAGIVDPQPIPIEEPAVKVRIESEAEITARKIFEVLQRASNEQTEKDAPDVHKNPRGKWRGEVVNDIYTLLGKDRIGWKFVRNNPDQIAAEVRDAILEFVIELDEPDMWVNKLNSAMPDFLKEK